MYVDPAYVTKQVSLVDKPAPRDFEQAALKKGPDNWKLANKKITAFQGVLKQNVNNTDRNNFKGSNQLVKHYLELTFW